MQELQRSYKEFLQKLLRNRQVPAESLAEVSDLLGFHGDTAGAGAGRGSESIMRLRAPAKFPSVKPETKRPEQTSTLSRSLRTIALAVAVAVGIFAFVFTGGSLLLPGMTWKAPAILAAGATLALAGIVHLIRMRK
jgi:hypothetical protein